MGDHQQGSICARTGKPCDGHGHDHEHGHGHGGCSHGAQRRAATTLLGREHGVARLGLVLLQRIAGAVGAREADATAHLAGLVELLSSFVHGAHQEREEAILFPALEKAGLGNAEGPIGILLADHARLGSAIGQLAELARDCAAGDEEAVRQLGPAVRVYGAVLAEHLHKEEEVLFPIVDLVLLPEEEAEILARLDGHRDAWLGAGHDRFHELLHALIARYLPPAEGQERP